MTAQEKKLLILKKIKDKWDLGNPKMLRMHWSETLKWCQEAEIEYGDLMAILSEFQRENIIENFRSYDPSM
jgi:hypothetical protein